MQKSKLHKDRISVVTPVGECILNIIEPTHMLAKLLQCKCAVSVMINPAVLLMSFTPIMLPIISVSGADDGSKS